MKPSKSLRASLTVSWTAHAVAMIVGMFLMPFVLHTVGDEAYGTWIFINSIAGYSGLLYLGFGQTGCRYVAEAYARQDWDRLNQVASVVTAVYCCLATVLCVAALLIACLIPDSLTFTSHSAFEVRVVVLLLGLNAAIGMVGSIFGGVLHGIGRFDIERGVGIVGALLRLGLTVWFLNVRWALLDLALIFLIVTIFENVAHAFFAYRCLRTLSIRPRHVHRPVVRECFSFSLISFLNVIAHHVIEASDTILIGLIYGARATVPYFVALRLCKLVSKPVSQIGEVWMPRAGALQATMQSEALHRLLAEGLGMSLALMAGFFIGSIYFGDDLIETWVGPGYPQSYRLLLVLMASQMIATPIDVVRLVLYGMGRVRIPAFIYLTEAVANIALSLILVNWLGLYGVALGTTIPLVLLELGLMMPYASRQLKYPLWEIARDAVLPQILPLVALVAYCIVVSSTFPRIHGWPALCAVTAAGGAVLFAARLALHVRARRIREAVAAGESVAG